MTRRWSQRFRHRMGQGTRAWPMLGLLFTAILAGIGCVVFFMQEAMRNEQLAARERLGDAYRGQLALIQRQVETRWQEWRAQLDHAPADAAHFARAAQGNFASSLLCFDADGRLTYPQYARPTLSATPGGKTAGAALQEEIRRLVESRQTEALVASVVEKFAPGSPPFVDTQGRLVAPNAELLALELLVGRSDPRIALLAERLQARASDYTASAFPSAQRVFVMRELTRLLPGTVFPTLAAEELAGRFLEAHPAPAREERLRVTALPDVWSVATPSRRVLALLTTADLRARLASMAAEPAPPRGGMINFLAPGEDAPTEKSLVTTPLSTALPGWRLSLAPGDGDSLADAANRRVSRYLLIGSLVIAAMLVLALLTGRNLGRQVHLARLKNDLVANVSHELKTPLTAMRALVETLLEAEHFDEQQTREYLRLMATENARLSRMIDNFLTFSRLERNKFTFHFAPLRAAVVVEAAVAALGPRFRAPGCQFTWRVSPDVPEFPGDADALVMALLNLLENAWKYTGDEKVIDLSAVAQDGSVTFAVRDNGAGLTPAESRAVFDRFHQADNRLSRPAGGSGLGLSIARSIVVAHGGTVEVVSTVGRGSTFTIAIPAGTRRTA